MTVIAAALTFDNGIVIVGDSELSNNFTRDTDGYSKVWVDEVNEGYIFGGAGNLRELQIIKYHVQWPFYRDIYQVEEFVVKEVVPKMRDALLDNGVKMENYESSFIMAWDDNLVVIDENFGVTIPLSSRYAIGSGQSEALGALGNQGGWSKKDVIEAANRATVTAVGVGGPLYMVNTKDLIVEQVFDY
jgi:ATP-dependent protease HslVU (ClpYQ) peptidase subunit